MLLVATARFKHRILTSAEQIRATSFNALGVATIRA
jgi:hypothetical protein